MLTPGRVPSTEGSHHSGPGRASLENRWHPFKTMPLRYLRGRRGGPGISRRFHDMQIQNWLYACIPSLWSRPAPPPPEGRAAAPKESEVGLMGTDTKAAEQRQRQFLNNYANGPEHDDMPARDLSATQAKYAEQDPEVQKGEFR